MIEAILLLFLMIFLHVVDDYYLQGILAQMKQRSWWNDAVRFNDKYKYDYIAALVAHAFSWSFVVCLPLAILSLVRGNTELSFYVALSYIWMTFIHALTDHLKANVHCINLIEDQCIHLVQITALWFVAEMFVGV